MIMHLTTSRRLSNRDSLAIIVEKDEKDLLLIIESKTGRVVLERTPISSNTYYENNMRTTALELYQFLEKKGL